MSKIHPTAVIDKKAHLAPDVTVGPYAVIEGSVSVGPGSWIGSHVVISGAVAIGKNCRIFPFAALGTPPQDRTFKGGESRIEIGDENVIREQVTIHPGTPKGGGLTKIGSRNWFLVASHVAHDCTVGDDNTFANWSALAGHVHLASHVMVSAFVAVHQFCRVGRLAMIGGITGVPLDIPPFAMVQGNRGRLMGLNRVGLRRAGFTLAQIRTLQDAYHILFRRKGAIAGRLAAVRKLADPLAEELADFVQHSKRGVCTREEGAADEAEEITEPSRRFRSLKRAVPAITT